MRLVKTSLITKLLLVVVAVYALITLVSLQDRIHAAAAEAAELEAAVLYAEQDYAQVEQDLAEFGSDASIKKLARSRLGMVEEGEIVFLDADMQN